MTRPMLWNVAGALPAALAVLCVLSSACSFSVHGHELPAPVVFATAEPGFPRAPDEIATQAPPERLRVQVLAVLSHDRGAFTQGLLWDNGALYESTGLYARSSLRQLDRTTGEVVRAIPLDPRLFGEGLTQVGDRLIQLTWMEGVALVYDLRTFERLGQLSYEGEGWGLCYDGERLIMSDGSSSLALRDAQTFERIGSITVILDGRPVERLNELECVGDRVYANVWQTDTILRIDARTGRVDAVIDASALLAPPDRLGADVLNGIAYDAEKDVFLITGKLWPRLFEVRFVP